MKKAPAYLIIGVLVLTVFGCENYDKATQGVEKVRKFVGDTEKKVTETKEGAEKSIAKILGEDTGKSEAEKSESKQNKKEEKD